MPLVCRRKNWRFNTCQVRRSFHHSVFVFRNYVTVSCQVSGPSGCEREGFQVDQALYTKLVNMLLEELASSQDLSTTRTYIQALGSLCLPATGPGTTWRG